MPSVPHLGKVVTVCSVVATVKRVAIVNGQPDPSVLVLRGDDGHEYHVLARVVAEKPETLRRASFVWRPEDTPSGG